MTRGYVHRRWPHSWVARYGCLSAAPSTSQAETDLLFPLDLAAHNVKVREYLVPGPNKEKGTYVWRHVQLSKVNCAHYEPWSNCNAVRWNLFGLYDVKVLPADFNLTKVCSLPWATRTSSLNRPAECLQDMFGHHGPTLM